MNLVKKEFENVKVLILIEIIEMFGYNVNYYIEIKIFDEYLGMEEKLLEIINYYEI